MLITSLPVSGSFESQWRVVDACGGHRTASRSALTPLQKSTFAIHLR